MENEELSDSKEWKQALTEVARCARTLRTLLWVFAAVALVWATATVVTTVYGLISQRKMEGMLEGVNVNLKDSMRRSESEIDWAKAAASPDAASGAPEAYLSIFFAVQKADEAAKSGDSASARDHYRRAQDLLDTLKKANPDWRTDLVGLRERYITERLDAIEKAAPAPPPETLPLP